MTTGGMSIDHPRRLPIQVPLQPEESPDAFVRRLAIANHLRPTYLRTYLSDPPGSIGSIQVWRLAAVTGRTEQSLVRLMPSLAPIEPTRRRRTPPPDLHTAIRHAAQRDDEVQRLGRKYGLPRQTIINALLGQVTTSRFQQRMPHHSPILNDVAAYLDQLIADQPGASIWSIWKTLGEQRQTTVSYGTVRNYVNRRRTEPADAASAKYFLTRADLFATIAAEATNPDLIARLVAHLSLDAATIKHALTGQNASRTRNQSQHNPILDDYRCHIDDMVAADPAITVAAIWERLVDHYRVAVSYATVRAYIAREHRPPRPRARPQTATTTRPVRPIRNQHLTESGESRSSPENQDPMPVSLRRAKESR